MTSPSIASFTPRAFTPGVTSEMREGRCVYWYDGPIILWLHGPPGDLLAMAISPDDALQADYVAIQLNAQERNAYTAGAVDMRTLIILPEVRLFAVDWKTDGTWTATRIEGPLPDQHLPDQGMVHVEFPIFASKGDTHD